MAIDPPRFFSPDNVMSGMKDRRHSFDLTHEQLSQLTKAVDPTSEGVSRVALSRYETGASQPGVRELRLISLALRLPLSMLVYGEPTDPMLKYRLALEMRIMEVVNNMVTAEGLVKDEDSNDPERPEFKALLEQVKKRSS